MVRAQGVVLGVGPCGVWVGNGLSSKGERGHFDAGLFRRGENRLEGRSVGSSQSVAGERAVACFCSVRRCRDG